jgi:hypothetical protein
MNVELEDACVALLHRVVNEVQLSFAAAASPAPIPIATASPADSPRSSMSSDRSSSASASSHSRTSSLLYSIFQPLLPAAAPSAPPAHVVAHQQPARAHRRQARSLLVDAYRRYVLPSIKERLPSAYLLWAIQSESAAKLDAYSGLRDDINGVLYNAGVGVSATEDRSPLRRYRSPLGSPFSPAEDDEAASAPQNFLLAIPPAHALPVKQRVAYSSQLTRLTQLASRIGSITKLASRYEREEGKRKWLEQLDLNRDADKAIRRAFLNGTLCASAAVNASAAPTRRSSLRNGTTAADLKAQERRLVCQAAASATAALEDILEAASDDEDEDDEDDEPELSDSRSSLSASPEPVPRTPTSNIASSFSDDDDMSMSPSPASHKSFEDTPLLMPSRSDDSLSEGDEWDIDMDEQYAPVAPLCFDGKKPAATLPSQPFWQIEQPAY